jgi:hypothetical protein
MAFNSIEELKAAVAERRKGTLTLEVDMGAEYSPEHEAAKQELAQAKGLKAMVGGGFIGGDSDLERLEQRVADTKPKTNAVWVRYRRLDLDEWARLVSQPSVSPVDQYEKVLAKTFVGVWGVDPDPDEKPEGWVEPEPLSTDAALLSSKGVQGILPGGSLHSVVQSFMSWQNSGGDVTIRPTKSGLV